LSFGYILCVDQCNLLSVRVYVAFRSKHPDEATMKEVLKELHDNNIDVSQFAMSGTDHCQ
jgi:hypothetical protein